MSGSFDGNMRLNERAPPSSIEAYPWISKTLYNVDLGTTGFLVVVEGVEGHPQGGFS